MPFRILAPALLVLLAGSVQAADFELAVPVEVTQLHRAVAQVQITCRVLDAEERVIGEGRELRRVDGGRLEETVAVHFDAGPGRDPLAAETYHCELRLRDASGFRYYRPREEGELPVWARPRPDSELVAEVTGALDAAPEGAANDNDGDAEVGED